MVRPERFELPACCSGGNRSIQLSYGRTIGTFSLHEPGKRLQHQVAPAEKTGASSTIGIDPAITAASPDRKG